MTQINSPLSEEELRLKHDEQIRELHNQLEEKDRILENYKKQHGSLEVFLRKVADKVTPVTPLESVFEQTKQQNKTQSKVEAVVQISDSHMGEVQEPDEIEGFNEVNPDICRNRNIGFTKATINWLQLHRNLYKIKNLNVLITGDLINGDIHQELQITNAFPTPQQVIEAAKVHTQQIALWSPYFERVIIHFISEDNHSRLTQKPQSKEAGKNSLNYLVGELMRAYLSKHDNVEFNLYPMMEKVVTVGNVNYLIKHGHDVRGWMGIPWYGIERSAGREAQIRQNLMMKDLEKAKKIGYHKIIHGHFHTPFNHWLYSCSGSVTGTNAYDHKNGRYSEPSQPAWMVHPKFGMFNRTDFQLKFYDK